MFSASSSTDPITFIPAGSKRRAPTLEQATAEGKRLRDHLDSESKRASKFNAAALTHVASYAMAMLKAEKPQGKPTAQQPSALSFQQELSTISTPTCAFIPNPSSDQQLEPTSPESTSYSYISRVLRFAMTPTGRQLECPLVREVGDSRVFRLQEGTLGNILDEFGDDQDLLRQYVLSSLMRHARGKPIAFGQHTLTRFVVPAGEGYASLEDAADALGVESHVLSGQMILDMSLARRVLVPTEAATKDSEEVQTLGQDLVSPSSPWDLAPHQLKLQMSRATSPSALSPARATLHPCTHSNNDTLYDPNMSGDKVNLDHIKCLACMHEMIARLSPDAITGFNKRRFTTLAKEAAGDDKKAHRTALREMRKHAHVLSDAWVQAAEFAGYVLGAPTPTSPMFLARVAKLADTRVLEDVAEFQALDEGQVRVAVVGHAFQDVAMDLVHERGLSEAYEGGVEREKVDAACTKALDAAYVASLGEDAVRLTPWEVVVRALQEVWKAAYLGMARGFDSLTTKEDWEAIAQETAEVEENTSVAAKAKVAGKGTREGEWDDAADF